MDEELSPQQEERVRRLLAEARHAEPMPADVAARLDRVIADLAADPAPSPAESTDGAGVVRLDERRRKVGRLLLVAAAVVIGGVGIGQVVDGSLGGDAESALNSSDAGSAEDEALPAPERDALADGEAGSDVPDGDQAGPGAVSDYRRSISKQPVQPVRSDRFTTDARRLQAVATGRRSAADLERSDATQSGAGSCEPGPYGGGRYLRVSFDGDPGWLVYRAPRGDTQVVDLFLCGEDSAERSATLPHR